MSNFVGNKPTPLSILLSGAKKIFKPQKTTGTEVISSVNIAKNLAKKKNIKDNLISSRDKILAGARDEAKVEIKSKNPLSKFTKKTAEIVDRKAKGGRVGLRLGSRKSNLQKIQEVFGPKQTKKKDKVKRMMAKKGSPDPKKKKKFPDLTGDGKVTFADILKGRGVINGKKKSKKKII
jgi:hypothetical protein